MEKLTKLAIKVKDLLIAGLIEVAVQHFEVDKLLLTSGDLSKLKAFVLDNKRLFLLFVYDGLIL